MPVGLAVLHDRFVSTADVTERAKAPDRDIVILVGQARAAALAVGALGFGLWKVRTVVILLLLALRANVESP